MKIRIPVSNENIRAQVLAALYNNSIPQGMGFLHATPGDLSIERAAQLLDTSDGRYFDYLQGRVLKSDLNSEFGVAVVGSAELFFDFDSWGYDRDLGAGAALRALAPLGAVEVPADTPALTAYILTTV